MVVVVATTPSKEYYEVSQEDYMNHHTTTTTTSEIETMDMKTSSSSRRNYSLKSLEYITNIVVPVTDDVIAYDEERYDVDEGRRNVIHVVAAEDDTNDEGEEVIAILDMKEKNEGILQTSTAVLETTIQVPTTPRQEKIVRKDGKKTEVETTTSTMVQRKDEIEKSKELVVNTTDPVATGQDSYLSRFLLTSLFPESKTPTNQIVVVERETVQQPQVTEVVVATIPPPLPPPPSPLLPVKMNTSCVVVPTKDIQCTNDKNNTNLFSFVSNTVNKAFQTVDTILCIPPDMYSDQQTISTASRDPKQKGQVVVGGGVKEEEEEEIVRREKRNINHRFIPKIPSNTILDTNLTLVSSLSKNNSSIATDFTNYTTKKKQQPSQMTTSTTPTGTVANGVTGTTEINHVNKREPTITTDEEKVYDEKNVESVEQQLLMEDLSPMMKVMNQTLDKSSISTSSSSSSRKRDKEIIIRKTPLKEKLLFKTKKISKNSNKSGSSTSIGSRVGSVFSKAKKIFTSTNNSTTSSSHPTTNKSTIIITKTKTTTTAKSTPSVTLLEAVSTNVNANANAETSATTTVVSNISSSNVESVIMKTNKSTSSCSNSHSVVPMNHHSSMQQDTKQIDEIQSSTVSHHDTNKLLLLSDTNMDEDDISKNLSSSNVERLFCIESKKSIGTNTKSNSDVVVVSENSSSIIKVTKDEEEEIGSIPIKKVSSKLSHHDTNKLSSIPSITLEVPNIAVVDSKSSSKVVESIQSKKSTSENTKSYSGDVVVSKNSSIKVTKDEEKIGSIPMKRVSSSRLSRYTNKSSTPTVTMEVPNAAVSQSSSKVESIQSKKRTSENTKSYSGDVVSKNSSIKITKDEEKISSIPIKRVSSRLSHYTNKSSTPTVTSEVPNIAVVSKSSSKVVESIQSKKSTRENTKSYSGDVVSKNSSMKVTKNEEKISSRIPMKRVSSTTSHHTSKSSIPTVTLAASNADASNVESIKSKKSTSTKSHSGIGSKVSSIKATKEDEISSTSSHRTNKSTPSVTLSVSKAGVSKSTSSVESIKSKRSTGTTKSHSDIVSKNSNIKESHSDAETKNSIMMKSTSNMNDVGSIESKTSINSNLKNVILEEEKAEEERAEALLRYSLDIAMRASKLKEATQICDDDKSVTRTVSGIKQRIEEDNTHGIVRSSSNACSQVSTVSATRSVNTDVSSSQEEAGSVMATPVKDIVGSEISAVGTSKSGDTQTLQIVDIPSNEIVMPLSTGEEVEPATITDYVVEETKEAEIHDNASIIVQETEEEINKRFEKMNRFSPKFFTRNTSSDTYTSSRSFMSHARNTMDDPSSNNSLVANNLRTRIWRAPNTLINGVDTWDTEGGFSK